MGRPLNDLLLCYSSEKKGLSKEFKNVYVSGICGLSLCEYVSACTANCVKFHMTPCKKCNGMLTVAKIVLYNGYCMLLEAFKTV